MPGAAEGAAVLPPQLAVAVGPAAEEEAAVAEGAAVAAAAKAAGTAEIAEEAAGTAAVAGTAGEVEKVVAGKGPQPAAAGPAQESRQCWDNM
jgi:hypothetical protein